MTCINFQSQEDELWFGNIYMYRLWPGCMWGVGVKRPNLQNKDTILNILSVKLKLIVTGAMRTPSPPRNPPLYSPSSRWILVVSFSQETFTYIYDYDNCFQRSFQTCVDTNFTEDSSPVVPVYAFTFYPVHDDTEYLGFKERDPLNLLSKQI